MLNEFEVIKLFFRSMLVNSNYCLDLNVKSVWLRRFLHFLSLPRISASTQMRGRRRRYI